MAAGLCPDTLGAYSAPPDPLAGLKGPTSKGRGRGGDRRAEKGGGERKTRKGEGRGGRVVPPT